VIVDTPRMLLQGYTPAQQAAINQYGYLPVGWSGAPIVMPPVPAPAPAPVRPSAPAVLAPAPRFLGPPIRPAPTTTVSTATTPSGTAPISFTGGGSSGGFDPSYLTISQQNLIDAKAKQARATGGGAGMLALIVAGVAALLGSG
jgi:hypothetical protein